MPDYLVLVREVHVQAHRVKNVNSPQEAIDAVRNDGGEIVENFLEYSHTLDPETWTVEGVQ